MRRPFGEWRPDNSDLDTDFLDTAQNVVPGPNSWMPFPAAVSLGAGAIAAIARGFVYVQKDDGTYDTYIGTAAKLYRYNSGTGAFDDVSRLVGGDYNVPENDYWSFVTFGDRLIAVNGGDAPQYIDVNSGTNFAALGGSPSTARFVTVMEDRVILSGLLDNPYVIAWSDINDSDTWTGGGGSVADTQELAGIGAIQGVFPAARTVVGERGLRSILPTGDESSFQFPDNAVFKGTVSPYAITPVGNGLFWLSDDDFYYGNADSQSGIGAKRIIGTFFENLDYTRRFQIFGAFDPFATRAYFAYPTSASSGQINDRILGYDWSLDRWFEIVDDTYVLGRLATAGTTLQGLETLGYATLADVPAPMGSRIWMGGAPIFAKVGTDLMLSTYSGDPMAATLETGDYQFGGGRRSRLRSVMGYFEGDDSDEFTVKIAKRTRLSETATFGAAVSQQASGRYPLNHDGFFHRLKFEIAAGKSWKHAMGFDPDLVVSSLR